MKKILLMLSLLFFTTAGFSEVSGDAANLLI